MPSALLKNYNGLEFSCRQGSTYDFKITTQEDYRFYRALLYYTEQGVGKPDYAVQHVPYSSIESEVVLGEVDPPAKPETDEFTYRFVGWETVDVRDAGSGSIVCVPGDTVGKYDGQLAFKGTTFVAKFDEIRKPKVSLGLAYIELDANGAATSWYGYYGTDEARSLMSFAQTTPSTTGGTSSSLGRALRSQPSHKAKVASTKSRMKKL